MTDLNGDADDFAIITPPDPNVVHPPTELQGEPWQSIFIFNPNQPPPPVLATRFFPPPPWPENLEGDNLTILPVVGPVLALTEDQMETPEGFALFPAGSFIEGQSAIAPYRKERILARRQYERGRRIRGEIREERREGERREERREETKERRARRRRSDDGGPGNVQDWPSGGGGE